MSIKARSHKRFRRSTGGIHRITSDLRTAMQISFIPHGRFARPKRFELLTPQIRSLLLHLFVTAIRDLPIVAPT
jgi:hypothetical protein